MKILVIGNGGRESALLLSLRSSSSALYQWPHNNCLDFVAPFLPVEQTYEELAGNIRDAGIGLVIIGPEKPLVDGLSDKLMAAGVDVFGPGSDGARLEGDKAFARELMNSAGVPSPKYRIINDSDRIEDVLSEMTMPVYIKASGLAGGKGAVFASDICRAKIVAREILETDRFGKQKSIVVEEFLQGKEISMMALVADGKYILLPPAADHKKAYDGDKGPNTGGMGSYAPVDIPAGLYEKWGSEIIGRTITYLKQKGIDYRGVLFAGLMVEGDQAKVLEFNCRFGDPETQAVLPLLNDDMLQLFLDVSRGILPPELTTKENYSMTVIIAAKGYPGEYSKGFPVDIGKIDPELTFFPAGVIKEGENYLSSGGRLGGISCTGKSFEKISDRIYNQLEKLKSENIFYRKDIGPR